MKNRWGPRAAARLAPVDALVYRSRLLGEEPSLGLYGGGNTSLKADEPDALGRPHQVLWVKGSGAALKGCERRHFAPLPLAPLVLLRERPAMSDDDMVMLLERSVLDPKAPRPSIETLLHAFLPERAIDHTHADAILALANTRGGEQLTRRALSPSFLWIPYLQPGFALSRRVWEAYRRHPQAHGAVLQHHGLLAWGPDGATSYRRTIAAVARAERFIAARRRRRAWSSPGRTTLPAARRATVLRAWLPVIRRTLSRTRKVCLTLTDTPDVLAFVNARRMPAVAGRGPATPDHMLRTKRLACVLAAPGGAGALSTRRVAARLEAHARAHAAYVARYRGPRAVPDDPFPRVLLIPGVGMLTAGKDASEARMVAEIYRHAMAVMRDAETVGVYTSVSAREAFNVEYWPLELYKLSLVPPDAELSREIGLVTGAAGGIGRALVQALADRGACVVATDLDRGAVERLADDLNRRAGRTRCLGLALDVTDESSIQHALDATLQTFGGLDFLVSNAGVAHVAGIDRLRRVDWEHSFRVNATGHFLVSQAVIRLLRAQGMGGTLVFIASKNVLAPGPDFGAYSAAKAAETQLARVLAIENGAFGVRVNIVNPDGVFEGSGLWQAIGPDRARTHAIPPGELEAFYQQRNLLRARVLPEDVANAVVFFVSRASAKTTGCILTVDGGLREAFPR